MNATTTRKTFLTTGIIMALTEIAKQLLLTFGGGMGYQWWYFPWQLCSIPMYACLIAGACRSRVLRESCIIFISDYGLLAGICAFLDTSGFYYPFAILTVHSFAWHILLILLGIYASALRVKERKGISSFLKGTVIYLAGCVMAEIINLSVVNAGQGPINMFYINPKYRMTQIYIREIVPVMGNGGAILVYILLTMTGAFIIHTGADIIGRKTEKERAE